MKRSSLKSIPRRKRKTDRFRAIHQAIRQGKSFLLTSHINPEGDAVCTLLALESMLKRLGKKVLIVCEDSLPERFVFLGKQDWVQERNFSGRRTFDTCFIVDCPSTKRIGSVLRHVKKDARIINLDHHVSNKRFGDVNIVDKDASSCGEIVYDLARVMKFKLTKREAAYLYVSIATDTGSFRYGNTKARTHRMVAEILEHGVDIETLNERLYEVFSRQKVRLYSFLMDNIHYELGGKVAWTYLERRSMKRFRVSEEDTEGFIDIIRMIRGVNIAFFITEDNNGLLRISFRSKGKFDVNRLARAFNGGGHKKAAGCTFKGTIKQAVSNILSEIKKRSKK